MYGFDLVNSSHDEIHISAFNQLALYLYEQIHLGLVYIVSNGTVKASNPIFNHLKSHTEIFLGSSSTIQLCLDEYPLIPLYCFNFKTIKEIQTMCINSMVELVGILISVSPTSTIRKPQNRNVHISLFENTKLSRFKILQIGSWGIHMVFRIGKITVFLIRKS